MSTKIELNINFLLSLLNELCAFNYIIVLLSYVLLDIDHYKRGLPMSCCRVESYCLSVNHLLSIARRLACVFHLSLVHCLVVKRRLSAVRQVQIPYFQHAHKLMVQAAMDQELESQM